MIELTKEPRRAVAANPELRLIDPVAGKAYALVGADVYERLPRVPEEVDPSFYEFEETQVMAMRCLVCEREITADDQSVHDATVWTSHGNYGSTVYDSLDGDTFLEAFVCDGCVVRKRGLVEEVTLRRAQPVAERRPPPF